MPPDIKTDNRIRDLITRIEAEQNATAFSALVKELNRVLDGEDPLRCPFCQEEDGKFRLMVLHVDGRYICPKCGHVRTP